jgi:fructokinase
MSYNIIGIGEILWDLLPGGKKVPGGAPANFAYVASQLGNNGIILSRVGTDTAGIDLLLHLNAKSLSKDYIQDDPKNPTGKVDIRFENGQPRYEIVEQVAWDFLELSGTWRAIATQTDAVCFGSLAQRNPISRETILEFVKLTRNLRIFDVNLRQKFFSVEILRESLDIADVVKLNHEELPVVAQMFEIKNQKPVQAAREMISRFDLELVCVTRGAGGSVLVTKNELSENAGLNVAVADTIGAGDAFTAALVSGLLRGWNLDKINEFANKVGAFVASQTGAMPGFPEEFKQ